MCLVVFLLHLTVLLLLVIELKLHHGEALAQSQAAGAQLGAARTQLGTSRDQIANLQAQSAAQAGFSGPQAYQQFMSPYQQDVIDATLGEYDRQAARGL